MVVNVFYDTFQGVSLAAFNQGVDKLKAKMSREIGLAVDGGIIRPVRPEDLGSSYPWWQLNQTATNTWTAFTGATTYTIADNRFVLINGVYFNGSSRELHQVRITREQSVTRYWDVTPVRGFQNHTGWADDPWTVDQNTVFTMEGICSSVSTLYEFDLIGAVAEKRGILINP